MEGFGSELCKKMLLCYCEKSFSNFQQKVNTHINKLVICNYFSMLKWNGKTQIIGNNYIMGFLEYDKIMKHYGTRSWMQGLPNYSVRTPNWVIKKLRSPSIINKLEANIRLKTMARMYEVIVYDLYDLGPLHFIKLKIYKRKNKDEIIK